MIVIIVFFLKYLNFNTLQVFNRIELLFKKVII